MILLKPEACPLCPEEQKQRGAEKSRWSLYNSVEAKSIAARRLRPLLLHCSLSVAWRRADTLGVLTRSVEVSGNLMTLPCHFEIRDSRFRGVVQSSNPDSVRVYSACSSAISGLFVRSFVRSFGGRGTLLPAPRRLRQLKFAATRQKICCCGS